MSDHETPKSIDRQLRNVALPPGLLPRLREIAAMGDVELDHLIGAVPLPEGALDRLLAIGSLSEADIDGELRDVELPRGMQHRVQRAMRWQSQRAQWIGWAVAASLLAIVTGVVYWSGIDRQIAQHSPNVPRAERSRGGEHLPNSPPSQIVDGNDHKPPENRIETAGGDEPRSKSSDPVEPQTSVVASGNVVEEPVPSTQPNEGGANSSADHSSSAHDIFGGTPLPAPPKLRLVQAPMARGVSGPPVQGYDLISELRWGRHPFVVPAAHVALRDSRVPIWTDTSSYELSCRMVESGRLPPPSLVHTEDFLAAMNYGFPLPTGAPLGIRTAAGPAPWGPAGMSLMQVGVQAATLPNNRVGATHLTLLIDASAAMRESGRWDLVRRALLQLTEQLGPRDRVSLVFFNGQATVKLRQANQPELRAFLSAWNRAAPEGFADLAAALESAVDGKQPLVGTGGNVANKNVTNKNGSDEGIGDKNITRKMVLIADGLDPIDERSLPRLRELLHKSIDAGVKWEMIAIAANTSGQDASVSPEWDELAEIGGHTVRHANTPDELYQRLNETLAGQSQVVAASVEMKITFNPDAVARYRLIGHELNSGGGLSGASLQEDLRSGQAATALYEVELKPDGPAEVAFVEVSWRDPVGDAPHHVRQPIGRLQFVASWRECALPLQTAAIAAETADVLRNSNVLPTSAHVLDQVAALAADMNPALLNRPGILRLKQLIEQARIARPARSANARVGS